MAKKNDLLRNQETPMVLGIELDRDTLTPVRRSVVISPGKDYGADPLGNDMFRMVPSGDIVGIEEKRKRLG